MSNNYEIIQVENSAGEMVEHIVISNDDGFTSMLKSTYDAMQAEQSTPNLPA
jgi:hypothetical protein